MSFIRKNALYIAWFIALVAMCGSLFFSNVLGFAPCILCWYQRVALYPLVFILGAGIIYKDAKVYRYVLPLTIVGGLISVYHNLLYYGFISEKFAPCVSGVSCTTRYVQWFGFISIPLLSLAALVTITILMFIYKKAYGTARQ